MGDQEETSARKLVFDDFPPCALCGEDNAADFLVASKISQLVKCRRCDLVYTSPRANETQWEAFLRRQDNPRNIAMTENRLMYGVALDRNVAAQPKDWRQKVTARSHWVLKELRKAISIPLGHLHDVGCGVGFFLTDARDAGLSVSGNDLNGYAVRLMRERFDLDVFCGSFSEAGLGNNSRDAVTMDDFIEHTYHPRAEITEAFRVLRPGGVLYIHTFRIDSPAFERQGAKWNMLRWNHVYHFSTDTLTRLIRDCGFEIQLAMAPRERSSITILAHKPAHTDARSLMHQGEEARKSV